MGACYHGPVLPWLLVAALSGCKVTADDLAAVPTIPAAPLEAPPPTAEGPGQDRLFQLLYAGEAGDPAFELGQRVRVRAWLSAAHFRDADLERFKKVVQRVRATVAQQAVDDATHAQTELAALEPVYRELDGKLAAGPVSDEEMASFAEKLSAARLAANGDTTPSADRQERIRQLLDAVAQWQSQLPQDTLLKVAAARFFLVRRASPFGNVGAYHTLVGLDWDGGEFSHLDETAAAPDQGQMDVGGLWSLEKLRTPPARYLTGRQVQAIVVLAALEPALVEVLGLPEPPPLEEIPGAGGAAGAAEGAPAGAAGGGAAEGGGPPPSPP